MSKYSNGPCALVPVLGQADRAGHLLRTARGFRAFDSDGRQIGIFENGDDVFVYMSAIWWVRPLWSATV